MTTLWVREFTGGLDTRRLPETTLGSSLIEAVNGHVDRGGQFEKRAAFVAAYTLPAGTLGLAYDRNSLVVFGTGAEPPGMPAGVRYQRVEHPTTPALTLVTVPSFDLYAGLVYVVAEYSDGSIYHFYNGTAVADFADGRARTSFQVTGGSIMPATPAVGSFEVTGGSSGVGNQVADLTIDGVSVISGPVAFGANNADTAADIAADINGYTSSPNYTATSSGQTVTITAAATGPLINGKAIIATLDGDVTTGNHQNMAGGANAVSSTLTSLTVNGIAIISGSVAWATSHSATASAIATAINAYTSSPDYTATAVGDAVNVIAAATGVAENGKAIAFGLANGFAVTPSSGLTLSGGTASALVPGTFVRTIGSRMHCVSGPNEHFSGIQQPTKWTTDTTGAGFIDMSTYASGAETLMALGTYHSYVAVFAARVIEIWYFDSDPALHKRFQSLNNTGTESPLSITAFGDNDLFYLDESGVRSLRARDSSNSAATADVGVPVDSLISAKLDSLTDAEQRQVIGLIEPHDKRFWLVMKDEIFVFSHFPGSKISAWSKYTPGFSITGAVIFNTRVYVRSGNTIYAYGGTGVTLTYDGTVADVRVPYLDGNAPWESKRFSALDVAAVGEWQTKIGLRPDDITVEEDGPIFSGTTYHLDRVPLDGHSTHISLRFRSVGSGAAKLGAFVVHYEPL